MVRIAVNGAAGRMGRRVVALAYEDESLQVVGACDRADHPQMGSDIGPMAGLSPLQVKLGSELSGNPEVVIDFSTPESTRRIIAACCELGAGLVTGTTGLAESEQSLLDEAASRIPVLWAPNTSLGINLLMVLVAEVASRLGMDYDIEIVEGHHRHKQDAPSGTALVLAESICRSTGRSMDQALTHGRSGRQPRESGEIGMHALRLGDEVGRHTVCFAAPGEEIQISHRATTRDVFAYGAIKAARWLAGRPPGRYCMKEVLGL